MKIGYAGLTHLGICSALSTAKKGFDVIAYHNDEILVAEINKGQFPIVEPGLDEIFAANRERLQFVSDQEILSQCDVVYIAVDVPTDSAGNSDLTPIDRMIDTVAPCMSDEAILVVLCQVPPGYTRGRTLTDERLFYQVETLIFGRALERANHPERFIIGCADPDKTLPEIYKTFLDAFNCPILQMRYESAELSKLAINCFLVASVATTNTLAELCEQVGADWSEIAPALHLDARIGPKAYLNPGLGIAGGNLERDLATVCHLSERYRTDPQVIESYRTNSEHAKDWSWRTLKHAVLNKNDDPKIAVLGLAYKENTKSTKNSPSLALLKKIDTCRIHVYDPVVSAEVVPFANGETSILDTIRDADVLMLMTPWPEFRELNTDIFINNMSGMTIIDPYAVLNGFEIARAGFDYYTLGKPPLMAVAG